MAPDERPRSPGALVLATGACLAGLGVAAGAFGAHLLKDSLGGPGRELWETGARYQMYHGLALLMVGRLLSRHPTRLLWMSCGFFAGGILLFSGSLYLLALTDERALGLVTPVGGAAFLAGWLCLALASLRPPHA
jgi:uncharacterized membrane protein YgdD (TMEM256/DUF423 family)